MFMASEISTDLRTFLQETTDQGPFVTIYLPMEDEQIPEKSKIQIKNLAKHAEGVMATAWPESKWETFAPAIDPFINDSLAWADIHGHGFGLITNGKRTYVQALGNVVNEQAMVTETPQILPLLLDNQRHFDFDLLALNIDRVEFYHNDGTTLTPVALPANPGRMEATIGAELRGGEKNSVSKGPDELSDQRRYYTDLDKFITDTYSKPHQRMLILIGLAQNLRMFHEVSKNLYLSNRYQIEASPVNLTKPELDDLVDQMRQEWRKDQFEHALNRIDRATSQKRYRSDLGQVVDAVVNGAVEHLYIQSGARYNGRIKDMQLEGSSEQAQHNNLLNDLADIVLAFGGKVTLMNADYFSVPVSAILRY